MPAPKWYKVGGRWFRSLTKAQEAVPGQSVEQFDAKEGNRLKTIQSSGQVDLAPTPKYIPFLERPREVTPPARRETPGHQLVRPVEERFSEEWETLPSLVKIPVRKPGDSRIRLRTSKITKPFMGKKAKRIIGGEPDLPMRPYHKGESLRGLVFVSTKDMRDLGMAHRGYFVDPNTGEVVRFPITSWNGEGVAHFADISELRERGIRVIEPGQDDNFLHSHGLERGEHATLRRRRIF